MPNITSNGNVVAYVAKLDGGNRSAIHAILVSSPRLRRVRLCEFSDLGVGASLGMNEETHSCPFTLPPHTLAAATLLAGCCHPGRLAQSTLGDLPLCQQWSITDHAQPAQSCRHSCGQLGGWPSPTGRAGSQPNCNTLPACPSVVCLFHLLLPVCLCLSLSVSVCLSVCQIL